MRGHGIAGCTDAGMRPETGRIDVEDDLPTLRKASEAAESENGVWMRRCARCNLALYKSFPYATLRCTCGWEWLS